MKNDDPSEPLSCVSRRHKKTWVLSDPPSCADKFGEYGWFGIELQSVSYHRHEHDHTWIDLPIHTQHRDYVSPTIRSTILIDGVPTTIDEVMQRPDLRELLTDKGRGP